METVCHRARTEWRARPIVTTCSVEAVARPVRFEVVDFRPQAGRYIFWQRVLKRFQ